MAYRAITEGAVGVDMDGIYSRLKIINDGVAISMVVHQNMNGQQAYQFYLDNKK